ncbi:MAG: CesT family type III secretion system chaperone [Verrucomicrobia bacterium]|nr:CesT family type III secretion system chaperone [Verrucomicrobiota bacterium]
MDLFAQVLFDLGREIGVDLYPDPNRICQINYQDELHIQLHYDEVKEQILIASFLCDVPPGKYREQLLRACLISNGEYPRMGTLAYSERNNKLTLFEYIFAKNLTVQTLQKFIEKGHLWKDAVENGKPLPTLPEKGSGGGMFGLKR